MHFVATSSLLLRLLLYSRQSSFAGDTRTFTHEALGSSLPEDVLEYVLTTLVNIEGCVLRHPPDWWEKIYTVRRTGFEWKFVYIRLL